MGFSKNRRDRIKKYILEKISERNDKVVFKTSETFNTSINTVYRYLGELENNNIIEKMKNPSNPAQKYQLVKKRNYKLYNTDNRKLEEHEVYYDIIHEYIKDLPINVQKIWQYSFMEMFNNAIDHSESDEIFCVIIRDYLYVNIVIQDDGIGIFEKIRSYYNYNTLEDAMSELFKGKLTTDSKNHSGEGIFFTSRILDNFAAISCDKIFNHSNHRDTLDDLKNMAGLKYYKNKKGTSIFMRLSNHSTKQLKEVFDMYSDIEGGFIKTQIPIRNIFENGYPVSRSQAKRLYNRFEDFEEVILDFTGVSEIGQGFSHELFVVFQNDHPNVKLIVLNANDDVLKMINHVKKSNASN